MKTEYQQRIALNNYLEMIKENIPNIDKAFMNGLETDANNLDYEAMINLLVRQLIYTSNHPND